MGDFDYKLCFLLNNDIYPIKVNSRRDLSKNKLERIMKSTEEIVNITYYGFLTS